ncbi:MAG: hypothetical protein K9L30_12770 [Desulfobacterales bacterium]|nr:hypothetical protein [Desulfobacterales bacterium]
MDNSPPYADFNSQFDFIKNDKNKVGVDTIFLYENIGEFIDYMSDKVAKKLTIASKNISPRKKYDSKIASFSDYAIRKIVSKLNIKHSTNRSKVEYGVPDELLKALHNNIPNDFEFYEKLKTHRNY